MPGRQKDNNSHFYSLTKGKTLMSNETVYLIDLSVRASECPDEKVKDFLEELGVEVLGCNGYEDYDYED